MITNFLNHLKVLGGTFSVESKDFNALSLKRLGAVIFLYPVFTVLFLVNWFFLLLDEVLFPVYRKVGVEKAVFIIGLPRSGTTFLLDSLVQDSANFTCFELWELIFAPSIIQKYLFLGLGFLDRKLGGLLSKSTRLFDRLAFGRMRDIHPMNLLKVEEDEVLFLYNFTSLYFNYFFPNHRALQQYLFFDELVPAERRREIFAYYRRCVQRHQYVFNRTGEKYFLSKNPTFIPKMASVMEEFPNAKIIYPLRSPVSLIPSTLSLNANIYSGFIKLNVQSPLMEATREMLLNWYEHAERVMREKVREHGMTVYFQELAKDPSKVLKEIYGFLDLGVASRPVELIKNKAAHVYDRNAGVDLGLINKRLASVLPEEVMRKI